MSIFAETLKTRQTRALRDANIVRRRNFSHFYARYESPMQNASRILGTRNFTRFARCNL